MVGHVLRSVMRAAALLLLALAHVQGKHPSNMHTVFLADCSDYFAWQSVGFYYSHEKSGQPGPVTRVMCCEEHNRKRITQESPSSPACVQQI